MSSVRDNDEPAETLIDYRKAYFEKGNISLLVSFMVMIIGVAIEFSGAASAAGRGSAGAYILSFGLFGFSGGITNWLAVHMLFKRIPWVAGSGVIPVRYKSIRATVKDVIMETFFDPQFLEDYLGSKLKEFGSGTDTTAQVKALLDGDDFDKQLDQKLENLGTLPAFAPVLAMGMQPASLKPMIKPFVSDLALDLAPVLKDEMTDPKVLIDIEVIRGQIGKYMAVRIQTLTEKKVNRLMEFVIRDHLGWLIVWGNVFGAIIGLISEAAELTPNYRVDG